MSEKQYIAPEFEVLRVIFPKDILHFSVPTNSDVENDSNPPGYIEDDF